MDIISILAVAIFFFSYVLIVLEHKLNTHKSAIALAVAGILWILVSLKGIPSENLTHALAESGTEVFNIVAFLLAAMSLVEILIHYRLFDMIRIKLAKKKLKDKQQFLIISVLTFFLSAILDNLTITIVMVQIARRFFKGKNLLVAVSGIVILANAGGAWSPIGDVTTIMLWLAGKFEAFEVIREVFIPSVVLGGIAMVLLVKKMRDTTFDVEEEKNLRFTRGEKLVISATLFSFALPLIMNLIGLPPYMGLLLGLGTVWAIIEFIKARSNKATHLDAQIDQLLQKTDIASIQFFIGILLAVSALHTMGILENLSHVVYGASPTFQRMMIGNTVLGLLSAVVDNVPLTALAIDILHVTDQRIWTHLALTVGTGGSTLIVGSVAGVIAMGMVKELTFDKYLKIAFYPAVIGYFAATGVWILQYFIF